MRLNRFFGNFDFTTETVRSSDKELLNQLKNVLRLKKGDEVVLCDGKLNEALCFIEELDAKEMIFRILKINKNEKEFSQGIILYCSVLKRENFELVVQKAVELGAKKMVPVIAAKTVKLGIKTDRLQKIIKEATEQSGRGIMPVLSEQMDFDEAVKSADANDLNLFCELDGTPLANLKLDLSKYKKIGVFIGPEGGWSEEELKIVKSFKLKVGDDGFKIVKLSPFTLRAETAAIAALTSVGQLLSQ